MRYHEKLKKEIRKIQLETIALRRINKEMQKELNRDLEAEYVQDTVDAELTDAGVDAQQVNTGRDVVQNIYRGTDRLGESLAANQLQDQYGMGVMEANMTLRAMYRVLPSKDILALMDEDIIPGG